MITPAPGMLEELHALAEPFAGGRFLEWGPGATTPILGALAGRLLTVEHDPIWYEVARRDLGDLPGTLLHRSLSGDCAYRDDRGLAYSTIPLLFAEIEGPFDFALIDGRRRVECAFIAALVVRPGGAILLHDFGRERYQCISCHPKLAHVRDGQHFRKWTVVP